MADTGGLFPQGLDRNFFNDISDREWTTTCIHTAHVCAMTAFADGQFAVNTMVSPARARLVRGSTHGWYLINADVVTDGRTKLTWRRCSEGQTWTGRSCKGSPTRYDWRAALDHAKAVAADTREGWRLPNVKELISITALPKRKPAIDETLFPNTSIDNYWTSTIGTGLDPWYVNFVDGAQFTNWFLSSTPMLVRLVKDTKSASN